jgi:Protein of unknown function (DUF2917)
MNALLMQEVKHLVASVPGRLTVRAGCIWLTRQGDLDDYVLSAGQSLALGRGDDVVIEHWRREAPALWDWQPAPVYRAGFLRATLAAALRGAARGLDAAAAGLAALARTAAAIASRAQGCIRACDSMASSGALQ